MGKFELLIHQYIYKNARFNVDLFKMAIQMQKIEVFRQLLRSIPFDQSKAPGLVLLSIGSRWQCNNVRKLVKLLNVVPSASSMFAAIVFDRLDILKLLVEKYKLPPNQKNQKGETPLQLANRLNRIQCATYLRTKSTKKTDLETDFASTKKIDDLHIPTRSDRHV